MAISAVSISNEALAELRESAIQSLDENSFQARECKRQYSPVLAEMLEAHEWGFAGSRVALAAVTNDRDAEWGYAYAMPQGVGTPRAVMPNVNGSGLASPGIFSLYPTSALATTYIIEGSTIYSWIPQAILEYGAADVTPDKMPALFRRALALTMASRMATTLRDKPDLKKELQDEAGIALQRAMADDINRQPNRSYFDDVAAVRDGAALNWPVFPALA